MGNPTESDDLSLAPASTDSFDKVLAEAVAAPPVYPQLVAGTVVASRYEIESLLGSGGMGTVYLARDRELDRKVALKLHRAAGAASDRLHREAIAMAKLAHPNVVTVFEVGELDGRAFVAMEYVPGTTLRTWLADQTRTTREVLATLRAAGEGLAAAHAANLVHRDVKPDNIFVGTDGRVRIGDFGLAQLPAAAGPDAEGLAAAAIGDLTATGRVVGTPAYMAPEQIEGGDLDARTDQYAFCVAAWEALSGSRPFAGATTRQIRDGVVTDKPASETRRVPSRIRRVLLRGLAKAPAERWPDMPRLLRALRSAERMPRIVAATVFASIVLAAGITWTVWPERDPAAACASAGSDIDSLLPVSLGDAAVATARRGGANGEDEAMRIRRSVDRYRADYRQLAQQSCVARARGHWSAELHEASRECAQYYARTARELLAVAPNAATQPSDVMQIMNRVPMLTPCSDPRLLASWRRLADNPAELDAIVATRAQLDAAQILLDFAQLAAARTVRDSVAASPVHTKPAIAGRLDLLRATIALAESDLKTAEALLTDIYFRSRAMDDGPLTLAAADALIDLTGRARRDPTAAARWIREGLAEAERLKVLAPAAAFDLLTTAVNILNDLGSPEQTLEVLDRAEALHANDDHRKVALLHLRASALVRAGKTKEAIVALADVIAKLRVLLGAKHPKIAEVLALQSAFLLELGQDKNGLAAAREAVEILDGMGVDKGAIVATAEMNLGATLLQFQDPTAVTHLEKARKLSVGMYGEIHPDVALIDTNLALVYLDRNEVERALGMLRNATSIQERMLGPDHEELGDGLYNLAVAERQAGKLDDALASAQRCAAIFAKTQPGSVRHAAAVIHVALVQNMRRQFKEAYAAGKAALELAGITESPQTGAWARLEMARALIGLNKRDSPQVRKLLTEARAGYKLENMPARVAEIDALLAGVR